MSGVATANEIGYTGIVHGLNNYADDKVSMACVIPFSSVVEKCLNPILSDSSITQQFKTFNDLMPRL
jgi:hypothetical protein